MPTYYLIYSQFVDTTVIKSAVILTSLRPGIVSTSWCRHGDFVLELARMHRVERCGHGTNLERRTPYESQMDMVTSFLRGFSLGLLRLRRFLPWARMHRVMIRRPCRHQGSRESNLRQDRGVKTSYAFLSIVGHSYTFSGLKT